MTGSRRTLYAERPGQRLDEPLDVPAEQALLAAHDRVVSRFPFQFPPYWYGVPPLLKKWMDDVLTHGWAFGRNGNVPRGKELKILTAACSAGGRESACSTGGPHLFPLDD